MKRKRRTVGQIAVMELAHGGARKKHRRLNDEEEAEYKATSSTTSTTSYIQLRSRTILVDHHCRNDNRFLSRNLDHDDDLSCCSSNVGSSEKRIIELPDPEDESVEIETSSHFSSRESMREVTPPRELRAEPEDLDSTSSSRRSTVEKMPTKAELEEFFAAAEKKFQKQYAEKYNYNFVEDEPLEGRYEWVRLKP